MRAAQRLARPQLPKRFYQKATAGPHAQGFAVFLDGRVAKTPARRPLAVTESGHRRGARGRVGRAAGRNQSWQDAAHPDRQRGHRSRRPTKPPRSAPRSSNTPAAISSATAPKVRQALVAAQEKAWSPILAWARQALGARFVLAEGVVHVQQSPGALAAVERALLPADPLRLAAISTVTTLTGSALIALALADGALSAEAAWQAAHVDEDWQMSQWGVDAMAMERRAARWQEMRAAAMILGGGSSL